MSGRVISVSAALSAAQFDTPNSDDQKGHNAEDNQRGRHDFYAKSAPALLIRQWRRMSFRSLVFRKCHRWGRIRDGFAFLEVHAFDETVRDGVNVPDLAV
jgi:hypothetical protein